MAKISRFAILFPVILSIVGLVLSSLALFAGHQQGFLEDYAVVRVNTSMIGRNLHEPSKTDKDKDNKDKASANPFSGLRDKWDDLKGDTKDKLKDITADVAGGVAKKIGIHDWYSLHIMNSCKGNYAPNATAFGASLNITNCTTSSPNYRFNLTKTLDHELKVGPVRLNLASLSWPDSIQEKIDILNNALMALFVLYAIGLGASGLAFLFGIASFIAPEKKSLVQLNLVVASVAALTITIGSIVVIVAGTKGVNEINGVGERVGIVVERGTKFYIISWVAAGCMITAAGYWFSHFVTLKKRLRWKNPGKETY